LGVHSRFRAVAGARYPAAFRVVPVPFRSGFILVSAVVLVAGSAPAQPPAAPAPAACELPEAGARWLQQALDGWELVRRDFLQVEPRPLPWILLYDASCLWELSPAGPPLVNGSRMLEGPLTFD